MRLYILSTQPEINTILHDHFTEKGYLCVTFKGLEEFFMSIEHNVSPPELIILDYVIFNHDIFNIYNYLERKKCIFPCIFYNDPCLTRANRLSHWKAQIELLQNKTDKIDIKRIEPLLKDLQDIVENKILSPSIKLMQVPSPFPKELVNPKITLDYIQKVQDDGLEDFRTRNDLPNSLFYLLKLLHDNQQLRLTVEDIKKLYEADKKEISESSLYVMLSKLRGIVRDDKKSRFVIRKEGEYYRFIKFISQEEE